MSTRSSSLTTPPPLRNRSLEKFCDYVLHNCDAIVLTKFAKDGLKYKHLAKYSHSVVVLATIGVWRTTYCFDIHTRTHIVKTIAAWLLQHKLKMDIIARQIHLDVGYQKCVLY